MGHLEALGGPLQVTSETTLLIDGDVIAYRAAAAVQKNEEDGFGYIRPFANITEGTAAVEQMILNLMAGLDASHIKVVLSDPEVNWRLQLAPSYKSNRADVARPLLLGHLKSYLRATFGAFHWPTLEADDVLGILATGPISWEGRTVVVGKDKDFKTIPGLHHTLGDVDSFGKPIVKEISLEAADRWHLVQTLAGDRVDGYEGCPGLGVERAQRVIDSPIVLTPERGVITRGPNKGSETIKWVSETTTDYWAAVVSQYLKAGKTEADALLNARLAHILRHDDYDRQADRITLWTPDKLRI